MNDTAEPFETLQGRSAVKCLSVVVHLDLLRYGSLSSHCALGLTQLARLLFISCGNWLVSMVRNAYLRF